MSFAIFFDNKTFSNIIESIFFQSFQSLDSKHWKLIKQFVFFMLEACIGMNVYIES